MTKNEAREAIEILMKAIVKVQGVLTNHHEALKEVSKLFKIQSDQINAINLKLGIECEEGEGDDDGTSDEPAE
ncbi:MAG TPA: hypothetical protein VNA25_05055 [Phycisphaerae bacterium]|nr:hypothetical protein [Phycisphaerae bacterium]